MGLLAGFGRIGGWTRGRRRSRRRRRRGGRSGVGSGLWLGDEGEGELGGVPRLPHPARPLDPFRGAGRATAATRAGGRGLLGLCGGEEEWSSNRRRSVGWTRVLGCACSDVVSAHETWARSFVRNARPDGAPSLGFIFRILEHAREFWLGTCTKMR